MFTSINLPALRNQEFLQFTDNVETVLTLNNPVNLKILKSFSAFKTLAGELKALFNVSRKSPLTETLTELDFARDEAIIGIQLVIEGYTHHYDEKTKKMAKALLDNLLAYGSGIARMNLQLESATLTSLINDWTNKPELAEGIAAFNLTDWKGVLATANAEFVLTFAERAQDEGEAATETTFKAKRIEVTNAWAQVRKMLEAQCNIAKEEGLEAPYLTTIAALNAIIDKYNLLINGKGGDGKKTEVGK